MGSWRGEGSAWRGKCEAQRTVLDWARCGSGGVLGRRTVQIGQDGDGDDPRLRVLESLSQVFGYVHLTRRALRRPASSSPLHTSEVMDDD